MLVLKLSRGCSLDDSDWNNPSQRCREVDVTGADSVDVRAAASALRRAVMTAVSSAVHWAASKVLSWVLCLVATKVA